MMFRYIVLTQLSHVVHEIVLVCMVQDWDRDQSGSILLSLVAPSTVERSDHPACTGGRSCQQVGSVLAGGFLYSGVRRSPSAHRQKVW
jgi:hypothetical protein